MPPTSTRPVEEAARWLLLIHHMPPRPAYLRVKVLRRLQALGAVAVKSSVYVLPAGDQAHEDLQWVAREVEAGGGEASICLARFLDGLGDAELEAAFRAARAPEYAALAEQARALAAAVAGGVSRRGDAERQAARLRRRFAAIAAIDFFADVERQEAARALAVLEVAMEEREGTRADTHTTKSGPGSAPRGATWVTRRGVKVDRIASAWLIRRRIDPEARFVFVDEKTHTPAAGELRFDMFAGEYTHEGDRCTFETLLRHFAPDDVALTAIAEIVHDIDLKDGKFGREETTGIASLIAGVVAAEDADEARVERGYALLDALLAGLRGGPP